MVANINPSIPNQMVPKGVVTQEFFSEAIQRTLWQAMSSILYQIYFWMHVIYGSESQTCSRISFKWNPRRVFWCSFYYFPCVVSLCGLHTNLKNRRLYRGRYARRPSQADIFFSKRLQEVLPAPPLHWGHHSPKVDLDISPLHAVYIARIWWPARSCLC